LATLQLIDADRSNAALDRKLAPENALVTSLQPRYLDTAIAGGEHGYKTAIWFSLE